MNRTKTELKRYFSAIAVFILGIVLAVSALRSAPVIAKADSAAFTDPAAVELSISNKQFKESSGSTPGEPSNWTGSGIAGSSSGRVVSGVLSLKPEDYNDATKEDDVYKLKRYPEYANAVPQTPFGTSEYKDTNKNVLMINTVDSTTAYGYTSETVTFAAGGFYRLSAYVKTGKFAQGTGAAIKLNGLPEEVAFKNIDTVSDLEKDANSLPILTKDNLYGFEKYTFYIAAPLIADSTVTMSLQVGDATEDEENPYLRPAQGYAFFDNIVAEQISANAFYLETNAAQAQENVIIKDFNEASYLTDSGDITYLYNDTADTGNDIGSFNNVATNGLPDGWSRISDVENAVGGNGRAFVYDAGNSFVEDNEWNLSAPPMSPVGKQDGDSKIFILHSDEKVSFGYHTPTYTVLRNTYYRLSFFAKTENINGGSGATAVLRGTSGVESSDNKLNVTSSMLTGDTANVMRYGWKQQVFYIKGSALRDYNFRLEFWLGQPGSETSGTAMFDEVRIEKITPAQYTANSSSGTLVTFDPTFTDTGVTNGSFYEAGEYEEYKYPLVPASWTLITPDTAETEGFKDNPVESTKDVVSGIISTESAHFDANRGNYNNAVNPTPGGANLLMISSVENTAIAYRSAAVSTEADKVYRMSVELNTEYLSGYGANLVLKSGNNVIATVEGIKGGDGFKTYDFYIDSGSSAHSVALEIWLGMNDRIDNTTKLASGTMFVKSVSFKEYTQENFPANYAAYSELAAKYDSLRSNGAKSINFATYAFGKFDLSAYDYYSGGVVKVPYNWNLTVGSESNVVYGIFDYNSLPAENRTEIPDKFINSGDTQSNGVLYLRNKAPGYSAISTNNAISLAENSYYLVQVSIKIDITEESRNDKEVIGAGIALSNSLEKDFSFKNIKDTSTQSDSSNPNSIDYETFKTYSFYIKTSETADIGLAITLGDTLLPNKQCSGRVYVNNIKVVQINNVDYETAVEDIDDDEQYKMNVDLSTASEDEDNNEEEPAKTEIAWWLIPSILFAVALLIVVIGTFIRKLLDRRAEKKSVQVKNSYDRKATLHKIHNDKENGDTVDASVDVDDYDEFDDTVSPAPATRAKVRKAAEIDEFDDSVEESAEDEFDEFDESDKEADSAEQAADAQPAEKATESAEEAAESKSEETDGETKAEEAESETENAANESKEEKAEKQPEKKVEKKPAKAVEKRAPAKSGDAYTDEFED